MPETGGYNSAGNDLPAAPQAEFHSPPQFCDGGPKVLVKNTFLHFDDDNNVEDSMSPPPLQRARTAPAAPPSQLLDDDDDPEDSRPSQTVEDTDDEEEPHGEEQVQGLPLTRVHKVSTQESFEPENDWAWAQPSLSPQMPNSASPISPMSPAPGPGMMQQAYAQQPPGSPLPQAQGQMLGQVCTAPAGGVMIAAPMQGCMPVGQQPLMYQVGVPGGPMPVAMQGGAMPMAVQMVPVQMVPVPIPTDNRGELGSNTAVAPPSQHDPSAGSYTPTSPGTCQWPPPPPDAAPSIERVHSGTCPPPMISPQVRNNRAPNMTEDLMRAANADADGRPTTNEVTVDLAPPMMGSSGSAGGGHAFPPQPQTLQRAYSTTSQTFRVKWHVDARKLKGNDKQAVSPPFELSFGPEFPSVTFKMIVYPKVVNDAKGGASFKKAKGKGFVQVKCEAELTEERAQVRFRIGIGSEAPRGPQNHNFAQSAVCGLNKEQEEFDFNEAVEKESQTFQVTLEIVPQ